MSSSAAVALDSSDSFRIKFCENVKSLKCMEHCSSEMINFPKVNRQIKRGCCLGHSLKYCTAYTGIDVNSGQLLYITQWNIKYTQMAQKCANSTKCYWNKTDVKCNGTHRPDDIIASIENQVMQLSQLNHKNLVPYECVLCVEQKEDLMVYLVQDFVSGTSILSITFALGWSTQTIRKLAQSVLHALVFLHSSGITHDNLGETTVLVDNTGTIRVTDFSLVPKLYNLIADVERKSSLLNDLRALGALMFRLMKNSDMSAEMLDFVHICDSGATHSAIELLRHSFLQTSHGLKTPRCSRLRTEFKDIVPLGAFGRILKARNILDDREYAIKCIPVHKSNRQLCQSMSSEVELLSPLQHVNVVRYFSSWIESAQDENMDDTTEFNSCMQIIYIQMEFCDNNTLRTAIDNNTFQQATTSYNNAFDLRHLLSGIIEGLSYIHKQDIIHRALKPENIFFTSKRDIKIGEFGLATTSSMALEEQDGIESKHFNNDVYVAPELVGNVSPSSITSSVDMYSLGIILLELFQLPFDTDIERLEAIMKLRNQPVVLPDCILTENICQETFKIVRLLLDHNPLVRPAASKLDIYVEFKKNSDGKLTKGSLCLMLKPTTAVLP